MENITDSRSIVVITTSFPIERDGSEAAGTFVADVVDELALTTIVRVVAPGRETATSRWSHNVEVFRYAAPVKPMSNLRFWIPSELWSIFKVMRSGYAATVAATSSGTPRVLALWGLPSGEWARKAARKFGLNYSVWLLGSDVWSLGRIPILRSMLARVIRQASIAYADGQQLSQDAARIGKRTVIFLPSTRKIGLLDVAPVRALPPFRLLFLGRWHINKGVDILLEALAFLTAQDWSLIERVEIQGGGPLNDLVNREGSKLRNLGKPVVIGSYLDKEEAEEAILRSDWVVIPSRIESIPVIFSDAMKLGRPVLTSPVGDLRSLVEAYRCGVVAKAPDADSISKGIQNILRGSASIYAEGTKQAAEIFSLKNVAEQLRRHG